MWRYIYRGLIAAFSALWLYLWYYIVGSSNNTLDRLPTALLECKTSSFALSIRCFLTCGQILNCHRCILLISSGIALDFNLLNLIIWRIIFGFQFLSTSCSKHVVIVRLRWRAIVSLGNRVQHLILGLPLYCRSLRNQTWENFTSPNRDGLSKFYSVRSLSCSHIALKVTFPDIRPLLNIITSCLK